MKLQRLIATLGLLSLVSVANAQESKIEFTKEKLDNGLKVIYAPMRNAPVAHVRVVYHVGSREERPDRQGFAHMFEHMMFRGSAHVAPEQHMKLIGDVGGISNAFTSFDQTTYHQTLPSNNTEMALYLEADRMASFKVNDEIFQTERKVVAEEWRMRYANQPMGSAYQDVLKTAFKTHSYRWTPIGDMDQLRQSTSRELQEFFNTYYVPNNACLVIAGDIDVEKTKQQVRKYFGWIPRGPDVPRTAQPEPAQTEARRLVVTKPNIPLTTIYMAFKVPGYKSEDQEALGVLGDVLSSGRTGRLDRALVYSEQPKCVRVGAGTYQLEDPSLMMITATVQKGADEAEVEKELLSISQEVADKGVTVEELEKIRTQLRQAIVRGREEADDVAAQLGDEEVFGGDANRVNEAIARLNALKPEDIQRVAKQYLKPESMSVIVYRNGPASATLPAEIKAETPVVPSTEPVAPRVSAFPEGYPTQIPVNREPFKTVFNKGVEAKVNGIDVITLSDQRLPLVNFNLIFRTGSHAEPAGKEGLASLATAMMRRGSGGQSFLQMSNELESRGISIEVISHDAGDNTRLAVSCTTDQLDYAVKSAATVLAKPDFPVAEFERFKRQAIGQLTQALSNPETIAERQFTMSLNPGNPQGRVATLESIAAVTLDDVKKWYESVFTLDRAFLVVSGDVTPDNGQQIAKSLLAEFERRGAAPSVEYSKVAVPASRKIVLIENPDGKQSNIKLGIKAFDIRNDDKFAGSAAGQILSAGIDSRLGKYVRAEKGLTYGAYAFFRPNRYSGDFSGDVDTKPETTGEAIEAMFKVFGDMRRENVTPDELAESKLRVSGLMAMDTQTIAQQASRRVDQILNGYPVDYYDLLPTRIAQVTADQIRELMARYVLDDRMTIVVVGPPSVKPQLEKLGTVEVLPMPLK